MSIREWFPLFALLEALIRYIDSFKTLIRSQRRVVNKWGPPRPLTHHYIAYDVRNIVCNGTAAWKIMFIGSGWMVRSASNHSSSTPCHFLRHYLGMSWLYMEGDWSELSHGPTYPHILWPNKPQSTVTILKSCDTCIMTRQGAIASVIEVRISTDLPGAGTSNCSCDPWSYDEMFAW